MPGNLGTVFVYDGESRGGNDIGYAELFANRLDKGGLALLAYFNDGLVSGFYDRGERKVYVTNGSGLWNGFTMRVGVPSEITFITLE